MRIGLESSRIFLPMNLRLEMIFSLVISARTQAGKRLGKWGKSFKRRGSVKSRSTVIVHEAEDQKSEEPDDVAVIDWRTVQHQAFAARRQFSISRAREPSSDCSPPLQTRTVRIDKQRSFTRLLSRKFNLVDLEHLELKSYSSMKEAATGDLLQSEGLILQVETLALKSSLADPE